MVNRVKTFVIITGLSFLMIPYTNCSSNVGFSSVEDNSGQTTSGSSNDSSNSQDTGSIGNEEQQASESKDIVVTSCANNTHEKATFNIKFSDPQYTCQWGKEGNLPAKNQYFQGRIEQSFQFDLPDNSKVCDIDFSFPEQEFLYDDQFLITFDEMVIASSYDFSQNLIAKDNLLQYDWTKLAGMYWDTSKEGVYCAATSNYVSMCSWPKTDTRSTIVLSYSEDLFQTIMAQDISRTTHEYKFITIGDNDDRDCEHSDVSFSVTVSYVK